MSAASCPSPWSHAGSPSGGLRDALRGLRPAGPRPAATACSRLRRIRACRGRRLRRLRLGAGRLGRGRQPACRCWSRAERRIRARQPADGPFRAAVALASRRPPTCLPVPAQAQLFTGNPTRPEFAATGRRRRCAGTASGCWCWAAARARGSSATWCRRPSRLLPPGCVSSLDRGPAMPARGSRAGRAPPTRSSASRPNSPASSPMSPARMAAADLVVTRSGASTVAELLALGRPSMLVPYLHRRRRPPDRQRRGPRRRRRRRAPAAARFTAERLAPSWRA